MKKTFVIIALCGITLCASGGMLTGARAERAAGHPPARTEEHSSPARPAEHAPQLLKMKDALLAFFKPVEGNVLSVKDGIIEGSFANTEGLQQGMRFKVLRKGTEFLNPTTGEPIGRVEQVVGKAEFANAPVANAAANAPNAAVINAPVTNATVGFKLLEGEAQPDDVLRISKSKVRVLFFQLANVNWALSEEYFDVLQDSDRFKLLTTSVTDEAKALEEAKKQNAEAVLILSQGMDGNDTVLTQKLLWVPDGGQILASSAHLDARVYGDITLGEDIFTVKEEDRTSTAFKVPFGARRLLLADLNGDDQEELLLDVNSSVCAFNVRNSVLEPAFGGQDIIKKISGDIVRMDSFSLKDKNGVIITSFDGSYLETSVYAVQEGDVVGVFKGKNIALREVEGSLYAQKFSSDRGFFDNIYGVAIAGGKLKETGLKLKLPSGVNLFDFSYMHEGNLLYTVAYDQAGYLNLYDDKGVLIWRSQKDLGGFLESFKKKASTVMIEGGKWSVMDRITVSGRKVVVIKRNKLASSVSGLGFSSSGIKMYTWDGATMEESTLVADMGGTIFDYAAEKDRLMVLASPIFGLQFKNILQGKSPITRLIYLFPFGTKGSAR